MAEADIHAPFRQEFDESTEMAGKPIPGFLCRVLVPEKTLLGTIHILCKHLKGTGGQKMVFWTQMAFIQRYTRLIYCHPKSYGAHCD